jgi:hypothetical protein
MTKRVSFSAALFIICQSNTSLAQEPEPQPGPSDPPKAVALLKCDQCQIPFSGLLFPEWQARKYVWQANELKRVKELYQLDQQSWKEQKLIYDSAVKKADEQNKLLTEEKKVLIESNKRSWWEQNGFMVGTSVGVMLTSIVVVVVKVAD